MSNLDTVARMLGEARAEISRLREQGEVDRAIERARAAGYTHLVETYHTIRKGVLKDVTVRSSFAVCSEADAVAARNSLAKALDVVASTIYRVSDYTVVESSFTTSSRFFG